VHVELEVVEEHFKILYRHSPGVTEEKHVNTQPADAIYISVTLPLDETCTIMATNRQDTL
jgi:hypothetical protein